MRIDLVVQAKNNMEIKEKIENLIKKTLKNLDMEFGSIALEHPQNLKMGDYSTNIAMILAKNIKTNPKELAEKIVSEIRLDIKNSKKSDVGNVIEKIEVAGAGFINFYLSKEFFVNSIKEILENKDFGKNNIFADKKIMVEYTQPNPFKAFHIGHLMSNTIGEAISRIIEFSGAKIVRANYQGDVGPHVAKAIYQMLKNKSDTNSARAEFVSLSEKTKYIGSSYIKGNDAYQDDKEAKKEIDEINKKIYDKSDEKINDIYDWGREITLEAFEEIYKILGTNFNYYFFESVVAPIGQKIVEENMDKVFKKSDGAIVFNADKYDPKLHTRVFITQAGLPTVLLK